MSMNRRGFFGTLIAAVASRWMPAPKIAATEQTYGNVYARSRQMYPPFVGSSHDALWPVGNTIHVLRDGDVCTCAPELVAKGLPARFVIRDVDRSDA